MIKLLFILLGTLSLFIAVIGLIIPGLPATPFLLLTAGLYAKSSQRLYNKLISNRIVGPHILEFRRSRGMTPGLKLISILSMWVVVGISVIYLSDDPCISLLMPASGILGTFVMLFLIRTADSSRK